MRNTMLVKYFNMMPNDPNYSELYTHMIVERIDNKIVTTYYSRWNSSYNKVCTTNLV